MVPIAGSVPLKVVGHIISPRTNLPTCPQSMVQLASHTTSNAQRPVVAATTTATATIVPIVIVQTPVCASEGCLDREMVGKRARMLTNLITGAQSHSHDCILWRPAG
jgi:hypothetical protein